MKETGSRKKHFLVVIAVSIALISYFHYSTNPGIRDLHNVFSELYYLPLLMAALIFGLRGAVITYICISMIYFPHVLMHWTSKTPFILNQLLHGLFSGAFAFLAGYLVDREKKNREQAERDRYLAGLGQASAAIAHDLRNPLISILGFARRLHQGKGDVAAASDTIMKSAVDMEAIVNNVLDFSKPIRMDLKESGISGILGTVSEYCRVKADEKGVALSVHKPDEDVIVPIDSSHMTRALTNLVNNAIEASGKGEVVDISVESERGSLVIMISDNGVGMGKETLENIFIPFYTKKSTGTGLGMAIAKKVIEGHRGEIRIKSRKGSGTEVILKLPLNWDQKDKSRGNNDTL